MRARKVVGSIAASVMVRQGAAGTAGATESNPGAFGCKVTTLRLWGGTSSTTELGVVNEPNTPCIDDSFISATLSASAQSAGLINQSLELDAAQTVGQTDVEPRSTTASLSVSDLSLEYTDMDRLTDMTSRIDADAILFSVGAECVDNPQGKPTAQHPTFEAMIGDIFVDGELALAGFWIRGKLGEMDESGSAIPIEDVGTLHLLESNEVDTDPGHKNEEINLTVLRLETPEFNLELGEIIADFSNQPCAPGQTD